ncbi:3'-5' exonuclease [bacterium]|nr:3'-5' exonuclease [bacterium]
MDKKLMQYEFIAFDTETTGFYPVQDKIIEVSAIKFKIDGTILAKFDELIDPKMHIPVASSKVHGLYDQDVQGKPEIKEILSKFVDFIGDDSILIAHNADFDLKFIGAELLINHLELPKVPIWDTLSMSRAFVKNIMNHKLETLVNHFDFKSDGFHRALTDSMHLVNLMNRFYTDGISYSEVFEASKQSYFSKAKEILTVQLPLSLMSIKKALSKELNLEIDYEERAGEITQLTVEPKLLYKTEKLSFLYATKSGESLAYSYPINKLKKVKLIKN